MYQLNTYTVSKFKYSTDTHIDAQTNANTNKTARNDLTMDAGVREEMHMEKAGINAYDVKQNSQSKLNHKPHNKGNSNDVGCRLFNIHFISIKV